MDKIVFLKQFFGSVKFENINNFIIFFFESVPSDLKKNQCQQIPLHLQNSWSFEKKDKLRNFCSWKVTKTIKIYSILKKQVCIWIKKSEIKLFMKKQRFFWDICKISSQSDRNFVSCFWFIFVKGEGFFVEINCHIDKSRLQNSTIKFWKFEGFLVLLLLFFFSKEKMILNEW